MKYKINDFELNVREQDQGEQVLFFLHYWGGSSRTWGVERVETLKQELIPRIPDAQIKVIPRTGHLSPLEVPDEIATGIRNFCCDFTVENRVKLGKISKRLAPVRPPFFGNVATEGSQP